MATEQDDTFPGWQQLQQQQQFQQAPQQEPADLVTYHESDPRPGEEGYEEEAPNIRSEPEPRQNAVVEGDDADLEQKQEEEPDEDAIEDTIELKIRNDFGDEQTQAVSIRGPKEAVERVKNEQMLYSDYTRKTTELARQRDGVAEAVRQAQDQARTQYVQQLEAAAGSTSPVSRNGGALMNARETFVNATNTLPCLICGETTVIAYPGLRPHYAAVRCFEGHFQGWTPWPDWGTDEPRGYDS
jgi:hypothetical protein